MKSCVTISLVAEARGGPFVLWDDLSTSCELAASMGYDAVEIFAPGPEAIPSASLAQNLADLNLKLAAVGTGAGWVKHGLSLTAPNEDQRQAAIMFIESMIDLGGPFGASAIIGSMQGRFGGDVDEPTALGYLRHALTQLGKYASKYDVPLIYEPLNRYETNLCNTMQEGVELLKSTDTDNVVLLADLFHMNIEESDVGDALRVAKDHVGHVHFVDSNRQPAGAGHLDFAPVIQALKDIEYSGYLSAEALPFPDPKTAAQMTIEAFRHWTSTS